MNKFFSFFAFLTVFLSLYGLLHYYIFRKIVNALSPAPLTQTLIIILLCLLLLSPILLQLLGERDTGLLKTVISYTGYFWMGILFLASSIYLLTDICQFILFMSSRLFSPGLIKYTPDTRTVFYSVLFIIAAINIYGWHEAREMRVERISIRTSKLPPDIKGLRVVQISDIHFSVTNDLGLAQRIASLLKDLKPDILVSSGDLIDLGMDDREEIERLFAGISATYGKFATTGNHEFYSGIKECTAFTEKAGFRMLRNEVVDAGGFIGIAAVDDPAGRSVGEIGQISEVGVLNRLSPDRLNIFLKHQPRVEKESIGRFDIQLSGHTHKGQIFPFTLIVSLFYKYMDGFFDLGNGSSLYVSRGTGTWGPPIRFLTFPEITVIEFIK